MELTAVDAALIAAPVLCVGVTDSGRWSGAVVELAAASGGLLVVGADHSLAISHADAIASSLAAFVEGHPIPPKKVVCVIRGEPRQ